MLGISLILIGIVLRFIPHAPNFTPVAAIALFSGIYLPKKYRYVVPLLLMVLSDLVIGMHDVVLFTWGGFLLVTLMASWINRQKSIAGITIGSLAASLLFYVVTNFGVWLMGWYPHTLKGLVACYVLALPFLRNFTAATLLYAAVLFGAYELVARSVKDTKLSNVLLS